MAPFMRDIGTDFLFAGFFSICLMIMAISLVSICQCPRKLFKGNYKYVNSQPDRNNMNDEEYFASYSERNQVIVKLEGVKIENFPMLSSHRNGF